METKQKTRVLYSLTLYKLKAPDCWFPVCKGTIRMTANDTKFWLETSDYKLRYICLYLFLVGKIKPDGLRVYLVAECMPASLAYKSPRCVPSHCKKKNRR